MTVEYLDGYLIYLTGVTGQSFVKRLRAHTREYRKGTYTLFDLTALKQGRREEIWHGFYSRKTHLREKYDEYEARRHELHLVAYEQLATFRIFAAPFAVSPVAIDSKRVRFRIESAIMNVLYATPGPVSVIPDAEHR